MTVVPIVSAVVIGLVFGLARGGRLAAIARTRLRHPEFLVVAVVCGIVADTTDLGVVGPLAVVGLVGGVAFTAVNLHLRGMAVIGVGLVANLVPLALNGAMPVRPEALVEAEMVARADLDRVALSGARELAGAQTRVDSLGDTFPLRPTRQVLSLGDLIMLVGLADVIANLTLQRRRRRLPAGALPSLATLGWVETPDDEGSVIDLRPAPGAIDLRGDASQPVEASTSASPVHD